LSNLNKLIIILLLFLTSLTIKGEVGNPTPFYIHSRLQSAGKPFELSPERNRYAQLLALSEYGTFDLPFEVAKIVTPDLGYIDGRYVSIYPPGFTLLALPFYLIGKQFNLAQLATYFLPSLFAIISIIFILNIAKSIGLSQNTAILAGFIFIFGTNSWAYTTSLSQHLITSFLLLISIRLLLFSSNFWYSGLIWATLAFAACVDFPNVVIFLPVLLATAIHYLFVQKKLTSLVFNMKLSFFYSSIVMLPILFAWGYYNFQVFHKPIAIGLQTVHISSFDDNNQPIYKRSGNIAQLDRLIQPGRLMNGLSVLLFSKDRGLIIFSPVMFMSLWGIKQLVKKNRFIAMTLLWSIVLTVLLYAMWVDPWGGWAFGPRYLIPAFALFSIFLAAAIEKYRKNWIFMITFIILAVYSFLISGLGAVTSNAIPPYREAVGIGSYYNFLRNYEYLIQGVSGSFIYNTFLRGFISLPLFYLGLMSVVLCIFFLLLWRVKKSESIFFFEKNIGWEKIHLQKN